MPDKSKPRPDQGATPMTDPRQCSANERCVLQPDHADYCLDERPLFEELRNIAAADGGGRWPGDTLSHRTAAACVRFGWAERNDAGNFEATPRGRFLASFDDPGAS